MESSIRVEGLKLDFLLYRKRGMTFKEWFVGMFDGNARRARKSEVFSALRGINLEVRQGERLGIIGPNGAGKTTLVKCIAGIYEPTEGTVRVQGTITPLIEISAGFNPELSGRDNIYLHGAIRGLKRAEIRLREEEVVAFAEIGEFIDVPMKYYSAGMVSRLAFSVATTIDPQILILDEVFAAGDSAFVKKAKNRMRSIIDTAHILLFVSHAQDLVRDICNRTVWLDHGTIIEEGKPDEVLRCYESSVRRGV